MKETISLNHRLAVWIIGPIGCGKTTLAHQLSKYVRHTLDQDQLFEELLVQEQLPLDFHQHLPADAHRVQQLRNAAADASWRCLNKWRQSGASFTVQTTGDKPHSLRAEVEINRQHSFVDLGIIIHRSLEVCQAQNQARSRRLPADIVASSWQTLQRNLQTDVFVGIFGTAHMLILSEADGEAAVQWIRSYADT